MTKREIASVLEEIAFLLELKGENPFKLKAYSNAARVIQTLMEEPAVLVEKRMLSTIKGIGPSLAATVTELVTRGSATLHSDLKAQFPVGLMELAGLPGLGPKKMRVLYEKLGISSLGELQYACVENRLVDLPGFGLKSQEKILAGIRQSRRAQGYYLYATVLSEAQRLLEAIRGMPGLWAADLAGEFRRRTEVIQGLVLVAAGVQSEAVVETLKSLPGLTEVKSGDEGSWIKARLSAMPVTVRLTLPGNYGFELFRATGSLEHVDEVLRRLAARGVLPESGRAEAILRDCGPWAQTEERVYAAAGLPYIAPELREGTDEVVWADRGPLPELVDAGQIQGVFHTHTIYSDGSATVEEMVTAARDLGYRYIGISDHSQSAIYANGLKEDRIRAQHAEISGIQERIPGIRIFRGIEADILSDGTLDYPDEILGLFDFVIASVHSRFRMSEEDQTARICRALSNPYVTMLGHPTGRLLLSRDGYQVDLRRVIDTAAAYGKFIEVNASPHRLELDWRLCRYAKDKGVRVSINPDAHSTEGLEDIPLGVNVARKGGLSAANVVNTLPVEDMAALLQGMRAKALS